MSELYHMPLPSAQPRIWCVFSNRKWERFKPSWENELCKDYNDIIVKFAQDLEEQRRAREEKLKSYESMSERELLIEIAKNTLKEVG